MRRPAVLTMFFSHIFLVLGGRKVNITGWYTFAAFHVLTAMHPHYSYYAIRVTVRGKMYLLDKFTDVVKCITDRAAAHVRVFMFPCASFIILALPTRFRLTGCHLRDQ